MVVSVKLEGLNIVRARGKYYVYVRETGEALLRGFDGDRAALERRLGETDMLDAYNRRRKRDLKRTYPDGTLGWLIQWFENDCPKYQQLAEATKKDYMAAFLYLGPEWDAPLDTITHESLYEIRDTCAKEKWPRFADKMIAALSSMFTQAMKRGKMPTNPAMGIDKAHKADPNANREWPASEWETAKREAPAEVLIPMMLARHVGYRGQTIAGLRWNDYQPDPRFGWCFRVRARKNGELVWIPAEPELQAFLDRLPRTSTHIATRADGTPWRNEKQMQTEVSHFLKRLEKAGKLSPGATLHGLRVTYAAAFRRDGADIGQVAAALGDRSEAMGAHYTRHVENEAKVIRAFEARKNSG